MKMESILRGFYNLPFLTCKPYSNQAVVFNEVISKTEEEEEA